MSRAHLLARLVEERANLAERWSAATVGCRFRSRTVRVVTTVAGALTILFCSASSVHARGANPIEALLWVVGLVAIVAIPALILLLIASAGLFGLLVMAKGWAFSSDRANRDRFPMSPLPPQERVATTTAPLARPRERRAPAEGRWKVAAADYVSVAATAAVAIAWRLSSGSLDAEAYERMLLGLGLCLAVCSVASHWWLVRAAPRGRQVQALLLSLILPLVFLALALPVRWEVYRIKLAGGLVMGLLILIWLPVHAVVAMIRRTASPARATPLCAAASPPQPPVSSEVAQAPPTPRPAAEPSDPAAHPRATCEDVASAPTVAQVEWIEGDRPSVVRFLLLWIGVGAFVPLMAIAPAVGLSSSGGSPLRVAAAVAGIATWVCLPAIAQWAALRPVVPWAVEWLTVSVIGSLISWPLSLLLPPLIARSSGLPEPLLRPVFVLLGAPLMQWWLLRRETRASQSHLWLPAMAIPAFFVGAGTGIGGWLVCRLLEGVFGAAVLLFLWREAEKTVVAARSGPRARPLRPGTMYPGATAAVPEPCPVRPSTAWGTADALAVRAPVSSTVAAVGPEGSRSGQPPGGCASEPGPVERQWLICDNCGLRHAIRPDGLCPRCRRAPGDRGRASAPQPSPRLRAVRPSMASGSRARPVLRRVCRATALVSFAVMVCVIAAAAVYLHLHPASGMMALGNSFVFVGAVFIAVPLGAVSLAFGLLSMLLVSRAPRRQPVGAADPLSDDPIPHR